MSDLLLSYPELQSYWEWLLGQPLALQIVVGVMAVMTLFACLFVFKNLLLPVLRVFGVSTPTLYSKFPTLPWRPVFRVWMRFSRWKEHVFKLGKHSSGGFASVLSTLTNTYHPKSDVPLGLPWAWGMRLFQTIGLTIETHMMVVAQSGAGKSVFLKTVISEWQNSLFIIDPKNEHLRDILTRKTTHTVVPLLPYDPKNTGQLNPFDCLREAFELGGISHAIRLAYRIGQSFIETPPQARSPFFTDTSRGYFVGLILLVESHFPDKDKHLGTVRDLIIHGLPSHDEHGVPDTPEVAFATLHELMMLSKAFGGAIAGAAAPYINAPDDTIGNLQATLQERTKVLDIPSVRYMLSATTRPLRELKTHKDFILTLGTTVSSIRLELQDLMRLITNLVVDTFENEPTKRGQCLAVLDEFNAQGYNGCLETALPTLRSLGLSCVPAVQDLEGLQAAYPKTYLSFIGNACATVWMSSPHPRNLSQLSSMLGKKTLIEQDKHTGHKTLREVDVATPEQLGRFLTKDTNNMIVTRAGKRALRLKLDPHFKALPVWRYNADPDHREALLRRITRFFINFFGKNTAKSRQVSQKPDNAA